MEQTKCYHFGAKRPALQTMLLHDWTCLSISGNQGKASKTIFTLLQQLKQSLEGGHLWSIPLFQTATVVLAPNEASNPCQGSKPTAAFLKQRQSVRTYLWRTKSPIWPVETVTGSIIYTGQSPRSHFPARLVCVVISESTTKQLDSWLPGGTLSLTPSVDTT